MVHTKKYGISWIGLAKPCCRLAVQKTIAQIEKTIDERIKDLEILQRAQIKRKDKSLAEKLKDIYVLQRLELEDLKSEISKLKEVRE